MPGHQEPADDRATTTTTAAAVAAAATATAAATAAARIGRGRTGGTPCGPASGTRAQGRRGQTGAGDHRDADGDLLGVTGDERGPAEKPAVDVPPQITVAQHLPDRGVCPAEREHVRDPLGGRGIAVAALIAQVEPADGGDGEGKQPTGGGQAPAGPASPASPGVQRDGGGDGGHHGGESHRAARPAGRRGRPEHRESREDPRARAAAGKGDGHREQPGHGRHRQGVVVDLPGGDDDEPDGPDDRRRPDRDARPSRQQPAAQRRRRDDDAHAEQHVDDARGAESGQRMARRLAGPQRHRLHGVEQRRMVGGVDQIEVGQPPAEAHPAQPVGMRVDRGPGLCGRGPAARRQSRHAGHPRAHRGVELRQRTVGELEGVRRVLRLVGPGERRDHRGDEQPQRAEDQTGRSHPGHEPPSHRRTAAGSPRRRIARRTTRGLP